MKNQPAVSIYIVTYLPSEERCKVLRRTCEGALAQRYPNFEVVVGDNGGSYSAQDALASIQDPRLKVFRNKENGGFTGNINHCIEYCENDVIKLICDDDLIHPDFLARTVPHVDPHTLVLADVRKYHIGEDPENLKIAVDEGVPTETRATGYNDGLWNVSYTSCCIPSATLFMRQLFQNLGGYDDKTITSDYDFFIEACLHGRVTHVKHELCYVGVWAGSLTEEMLEKPFFFPYEKIYTKFRVLRCKGLSGKDKMGLGKHLFCELAWQSLRPLKHLQSKAYRKGYAGYVGRFFKLLFQSHNQFGTRPNNP